MRPRAVSWKYRRVRHSRFTIVVGAIASSLCTPARSSAAEGDGTWSRPQNSALVEVLGNGVPCSLKYEHLLAQDHLGIRGGAGYLPSVGSGSYGRHAFLAIPVVVSGYVGDGPHKLQVGLGVDAMPLTPWGDGHASVLGTATIGHRDVPHGSGLAFGIGFIGNTGTSLPLWVLPLAPVSGGAF